MLLLLQHNSVPLHYPVSTRPYSNLRKAKTSAHLRTNDINQEKTKKQDSHHECPALYNLLTNNLLTLDKYHSISISMLFLMQKYVKVGDVQASEWCYLHAKALFLTCINLA